MSRKTILSVGTHDTKGDELGFIAGRIARLGGDTLRMDVSVLGDPQGPVDIPKREVAAAAGTTIGEIAALGDENRALQAMARGAARIAADLHREGRIDGMIAIGGSMGTDLALDCAQALPLGVPKCVVSTVAFSPLIPPHRLAPDIQMFLWAGGLHGMNPICRSTLSQAAGAVLGAAQAADPPGGDRPLVGMTSLGSSCLGYMRPLKPALEARGFDVAVFHSTGMGGMAFERLAQENAFACVMDFCMQEFVNMLAGSLVSSGADRVTRAGEAGIPQLVAPGAMDLLDLAGWQEIPERLAGRAFHEHNRLIKSAVFGPDERREWVRRLADRLAAARGPTHFLLPLRGVQEWDREGQGLRDPEGIAALVDEARRAMKGRVEMTEVDAHINDPAFSQAALALFDQWREKGVVRAEKAARRHPPGNDPQKEEHAP